MQVLDLFGIRAMEKAMFSASNASQSDSCGVSNAIERPIGPNSIDMDADRASECHLDWLAIHDKIEDSLLHAGFGNDAVNIGSICLFLNESWSELKHLSLSKATPSKRSSD
jgi:hypothetical protein